MSSNVPVRVGQIGCGHWASSSWLPYIASCPDAEITALCDLDLGRARQLSEEFFGDIPEDSRPRIYDDYHKMIADGSLDMVIAGTLAGARPPMTIAALEAGLPVLAAKPMAPNLADAEAMLEAAEKSGTLLMVGYNYRFRDDARVVHKFIDDGGIGKPLFARAWAHSPGIPSYAPHYKRSVSGGGALASTGVHPLDLAVWFLGCPNLVSVDGVSSAHFDEFDSLPEELEHIRGECDIDLLVSGLARFDDGTTLATESVWMSATNGTGVEVWGTRGRASMVPLELHSWEAGAFVDKTEEVAPGLAASFKDTRVRMEREVHHFVDCVLGRCQPLVTHKEMWTDQAIMDALYTGGRSFADKGW